MAKRFIVQTDFNAGGNMGKKMTRLNKGFGRFAANVTDGNSAIGRSFGNINKTIDRVAKVGLAALAGGVILASAQFVQFDQTIVGANARFKDFEAGSARSAKTLNLLKEAARETGKTTQFSAVEAAAGLNFYAKAGFTSAEAMAVLADTVDLATVAEMDFNRTADISSDLLGALGLNAEKSSVKIDNLTKLNRALGIATNAANVNLEDMFETLKVAGPIGTAAGENMNQLVAMTAALGGAGIKGSMGATALKNAYIRLAAPTDKVIAALSSIGLKQTDFIDQAGNMKSMVTIMKQLGDATSGLGKAEQLGVFATIFGKNAVAGAVNLSKSLSEIEFIMAKLEADTKLKSLADEIRKGLGMQIQILRSGLIELGFKFVEAFERDGRGALQGLIEFVQTVDITPLIEFSKIMVNIFTFLGKNWKLLLSVAGGIKAMAAALGIAKFAAVAFGIAFNATGVGLIVTAVGLLVTGLVALVLNFEKVKEAAKAAWEWLTKPVFGVIDPNKDVDRGNLNKIGTGRGGGILGGNGFGGIQTPSAAAGGATRSFGSVDININNNAGNNAEINQSKNMPKGVNVNMAPSFAF